MEKRGEIFVPNLETPNISPIKNGDLFKNLTINLDIDHHKLLALKNNFFLTNNFDDLYNIFRNNLTKLQKCKSIPDFFNEDFIKKLNRLYVEPFNSIKSIYENIFQFFLPKTTSSTLAKSEIFKFLLDDNLNTSSQKFKEILYMQSPRGIKKLFQNLYFLSLVYYSSYLVWLLDLYEKYTQVISQISPQNISLIQEISKKLVIKADKNIIFTHLIVLLGFLSEDTLRFIKDKIVAGRYKKLDSSVFKLLKKVKYFDQFLNEGILADQYGILLYIDNNKKLEELARFFFEKYKSPDGSYKVNKFNDRGVLAKTADNTETSKDIIPFVNVGIMVDDLQIGEISCRFDYKIHLQKILEEYNDSSKLNSNKIKLLKRLINEIDAFDHEVYKVSQEIKILRKLFVDNKILPPKTNLKKAAEKFINAKLEYLIKDFKNKLQAHQINSEDFSGEQIKYVIVLRLFDQTRQAIEDLALEQISKKIKQMEAFKQLDYSKQKELLKEISNKFKIGLDKRNDKLILNGNGLNLSNDNLNNLFKEFKQKHSDLIRTSIFFPYLSSLKSQLE